MQLQVKVFPRAKENSVIEHGGVYIIRVTAAPESGEANDAALGLLADHLGIGIRHLQIIRGATARHKVIELI